MATFVNHQGQRIGKINASAGVAPTPGPNQGMDITGGFTQVGEHGFAPVNLSGQFPSPFLVKTAPYKFTDPFKFAERYGEFQRGQLNASFDQARDLALKELDVELQGLRQFVPAASALKREQIALDNPFNQAQRDAQVNFALPGVRGQLDAQAKRAEAYASGRAPDEVTDRALELGVRSASADNSYAGGFGTRSSVARSASDLMSASQRIQLSQYGDQLLTGNIGTKASLLLAPTEYSDAGSQVRVTPEVGGARLAAGAFSEINQQSLIPAQTALSAQVSQNQFKTNLEQQTRMTNAGIQNQFALGKFQYDVGFAGAVAGAAQTNDNTNIALDQQARAEQIFSDFQGQAQQSNQAGSIASGVTEAITGIGGIISTLSGGGVQSQGLETTPVGDSGDFAPSDTGGGDSFDRTDEFGDVPVVQGSVAPTPPPIPSGGGGGSDSSGGAFLSPGGDPSSQPVGQFLDDTGIGKSITNDPQQGFTKALLSSGSATLNAAGISEVPRPGFMQAGYASNGSKMFVSPRLQQSTDSSAGGQTIETIKNVIDPTGAFSKEDATLLDQAAAVSRNVELVSRLDQLAQSGDTKGFIDTVLSQFKQPLINAISKDPRNQAGMKGAYNAYQLFSNWDQMSPAQKGLGLAATAMQGIRFADGTNLATKPIIKPTLDADGKVTQRGVTVGDALSMFQSGINAYGVVKNWDQLNGLQKLTGGINTTRDIAQLGNQFNLLGAGTQGAEVAGVTLQKLTSMGFTPAPSYGVGAIIAKPGTAIPSGYVNVPSSGGTVAIPKGTANTAAVTPPTTNVSTFQKGVGGLQIAGGALQVAQGIKQGGKEGAIQGVAGGGNIALGVDTLQGGGTAFGAVGGPIAFAAGAHAVYQNWGTGGSKGAMNGALGGAAMAGGLYAMGAVNPFLLGGIVAISVLGGMATTGKEKNQVQRDGVRDVFRKNGVMGKDDTVTLADGTKVNLGIDGKGGQFEGRDMATLRGTEGFSSGHESGKLNSYDIDYTNDLDYAAGMAGSGLSGILTGSSSKAAKQMGGQLGNALLGNVGHGKDMTAESFSKVQQNARAVYSQAGIKTKEEAYQLANQAFAEGRIDESTLITWHQGYNMVFDDNGFDTAQKLMSGRHKGAEVAMQTPASQQGQPSSPAISVGEQKQPKLTKEEFLARNKERFGDIYSGATNLNEGSLGSYGDAGMNLPRLPEGMNFLKSGASA